MDNKKYFIPEGMLKVVVRYLATHGGRVCKTCEASGTYIEAAVPLSICPSCHGSGIHPTNFDETARGVIEAVIQWLDGELASMVKPTPSEDSIFMGYVREGFNKAISKIRYMFEVPEVPEELKDLLTTQEDLNRSIIDAYRRGQLAAK
jgi:hypothetical protein